MIRFRYLLLPGVLLFQVGVAGAQQFPIMDKLADKVVQKYQSSSCQDLIAKKSQPQPAKREMIEQKAIDNASHGPSDAYGVSQPRRRSYRE